MTETGFLLSEDVNHPSQLTGSATLLTGGTATQHNADPQEDPQTPRPVGESLSAMKSDPMTLDPAHVTLARQPIGPFWGATTVASKD